MCVCASKWVSVRAYMYIYACTRAGVNASVCVCALCICMRVCARVVHVCVCVCVCCAGGLKVTASDITAHLSSLHPTKIRTCESRSHLGILGVTFVFTMWHLFLQCFTCLHLHMTQSRVYKSSPVDVCACMWVCNHSWFLSQWSNTFCFFTLPQLEFSTAGHLQFLYRVFY